MAENQVFEYSLSSGEKEQVLRMKVTKEYLIFIIEYQTGQIFTAYVTNYWTHFADHWSCYRRVFRYKRLMSKVNN